MVGLGCPSSSSGVYSGSFKSPYYPSSYGHFWNCQWKITVPSGYLVKLEFHTLELGARGYDHLLIRDGSSSRHIGYYYGQYSACTVYSIGTSLWFEFNSYRWDTAGKGFYANYTAVPSNSKYNIRLAKLRGCKFCII